MIFQYSKSPLIQTDSLLKSTPILNNYNPFHKTRTETLEILHKKRRTSAPRIYTGL